MKYAFACATVLLLAGTAIGQCGIPNVQRKNQPRSEIVDRQKADRSYAGTVKVIAVVSDSGAVCGLAVSQGVSKEADSLVSNTVKNWKFTPAQKDGRPVAVLVELQIDVHRDPETEELKLKQASGPARKP